MKIKATPNYMSPMWNAQSNQFPSVSVNAPNPTMVKFVFTKMMKGARKQMYRRPR